jgi:tRNA pseudouridine13 synthase
MDTEAGFDGIVKDCAEDFVVTEIGCGGVLASVNDRSIPPLPDRSQLVSNAKRRRISESNHPVCDVDPIREPSVFEGEDEQSHKEPVLEALVGKDIASRLERFSTSYRDAKKAEGQILNLGTFMDKDERTVLHRVVRVTHPLLKTITHKAELGDTEIHAIPDPAYAELVPHLPEDVCEDVVLFASRYVQPGVNTLELPAERDKAKRTEVHRVINRLFGAYIESKTMECQNAGQAIHLRYRQRGGKKRSKFEGEKESDNLYLQFCLKKENMETLDVINRVSHLLHCQPSEFSYSGVKDRKAVTVQNMVVKNITAEKLDALNTDGPGAMKFGNYRYVEKPLRLGDHLGNQFEIIIRNVRAHDSKLSLHECVGRAADTVQCSGFVNYYGRQRFGLENAVVNAWTIGLAMLREQYMDAVKMILSPDVPGATDPVSVAKHYFQETEDIEGTLDRMPKHKTRECMVLKALKRYGYDEFGCTKALLSIPYHMRLMYVHSFTSLVWNHLTTQRLATHGTSIVEGDLVEILTNNEERMMHVVTSFDKSEKKYSLSDVVLPLIGTNTLLPENSVRDKISQLLKEAGLTFASFK